MIRIFGDLLERCVAYCFPHFSIKGDLELDEQIDTYWASLDKEDMEWSKCEEKYARENLKMQILTDKQFNGLQDTIRTVSRTLQGAHSYDILANPLYLDDFQYVTVAEPDRAQVIIDDDFDESNDA